MGKKDFEKLKKSEWAQLLKNKRPNSELYTKTNMIDSFTQVEQKHKE